MKIKWKNLLVSIAIPLAVGGLSAFFTRDAMMDFETLIKPPFSPPGWLFPIVWTVLYILMGISSYIIYQSDGNEIIKRSALSAYALQLFLNFFWSIIFFNMKNYLFAFIWLILLILTIVATMLRFKRISDTAFYLLVPYLIWCIFALYLNFGIYILN